MNRRARRTTRRKALAALSLLAGAVPLCGCAAPPAPAAGALASKSDSSVVRSATAWSFGDAPGQAIRTAHYRIFTTERDAAITDRLPAFLEQALARYRSSLAPLANPTRTLDVYLMDNRPQWRRLTRWRLGRAADAFADLQRGGFAAGGVAFYFDIGARDTFAIAAHEGWHQYAQRTFRAALPAWLDEGIATLMEGVRQTPTGGFSFLPWTNLERFDRLRADSAAGRLMPLPQVLALAPAETFRNPAVNPLTYYAQAWALAHFLREGEGGAHAGALEALLLDAQAGRLRSSAGTAGGAALFRAYFGATPEAMDARYRAFIADITATGAREAIVAGQSPLDAAARR